MDCQTIKPEYNQRLGICPDCGLKHWYNIKPFKVDAYNIKYKMFKDDQRQRAYKDLLQPLDKKGKPNEEYIKAYGKMPYGRNNPNSNK